MPAISRGWHVGDRKGGLGSTPKEKLKGLLKKLTKLRERADENYKKRTGAS